MACSPSASHTNGRRARWTGNKALTEAPDRYIARDGRTVAFPLHPLPNAPRPRFDAADVAAIAKASTAETDACLAVLNGRAVIEGFWPAISALVAARGRPIRPLSLAEPSQTALRIILMQFGLADRVAIMARGMWPRARLRKWEQAQRPMVDFLTSPHGDLRHLEVGMPQATSLTEVKDRFLTVMADSFDRRMRGAHGVVRDVPGSSLPDAMQTGPGASPRAKALKMLTLWEGAAQEGTAARADINLAKTQAYYQTAQHLRSGIPQGHLMTLALSTKPAGDGWPDLKLDDFAPEVIWPYVASNRAILRRALGAAPSWPTDPVLDPLKALRALTWLPGLPDDMVAAVQANADASARTRRSVARALLAKC